MPIPTYRIVLKNTAVSHDLPPELLVRYDSGELPDAIYECVDTLGLVSFRVRLRASDQAYVIFGLSGLIRHFAPRITVLYSGNDPVAESEMGTPELSAHITQDKWNAALDKGAKTFVQIWVATIAHRYPEVQPVTSIMELLGPQTITTSQEGLMAIAALNEASRFHDWPNDVTTAITAAQTCIELQIRMEQIRSHIGQILWCKLSRGSVELCKILDTDGLYDVIVTSPDHEFRIPQAWVYLPGEEPTHS